MDIALRPMYAPPAPGKVIVASEFGAEGNRLNKTNAHGGLAFQAALLKTT